MKTTIKVKVLSNEEKIIYKNKMIELGKILDEKSDLFIEKYINQINSFIIFGVINEFNNNLLGFCVIGDNGMNLNLYSLIIDPKFQRNKIGSIFFLEAEKKLKTLCNQSGVLSIIIMLSAKKEVEGFYYKNKYKYLYDLKRDNSNEIVLFKEI